jgi:hypothetical protein
MLPIKRYLKAWDIPRDLCLNKSAWKAAIDVHKPWLGAFGGFQLYFTPICFGLIGFVVVVCMLLVSIECAPPGIYFRQTSIFFL